MSDRKTQEYIDLLDETIQLEEQEDYREDTEEYRQSQIRIFNFKEIKGIVKKQEGLIRTIKSLEFERDAFVKISEGLRKSQPGDDLVGKQRQLLENLASLDCVNFEDVKMLKEISDNLQSKQPSDKDKLIELLDKLTPYLSDMLIWDDWGIESMLMEIKWNLKEYEKLKKKHFKLCVKMNAIRHTPLDNDLVGKLLSVGLDSLNEAQIGIRTPDEARRRGKAKIYKLLKERNE